MISNDLLAALLFTGGAIAQSAINLLQRRAMDKVFPALIAVAVLFGIMPGKHEDRYEIILHIVLIGIYFVIIYAMAYREKLIETIGERTLLAYNAIVLCLCATSPIASVALPLIAVPSLFTLYHAFSPKRMSDTLEAFHYAWFFALNLTVLVFLAKGFFVSGLSISPLNAFLFGLSSVTLFSHACYLWYFIPIPGKHQKLASRKKQWKEFAALLSKRYSDVQAHPAASIAILATIAAAFVLNREFAWISTHALINGFLVATEVFVRDGGEHA